jgi:Na+-transporting methylmalonyl-CoA/oxaloacetate decarboxylase gamma subunit
MTSNQRKGYWEKMLSSRAAHKRAISLGFMTLGFVLILLSFAQVSEATSASSAQVTALEPEVPCDVCHEETVQAEQASVRQALQTVSAGAIHLQQQSFSSLHRAELDNIERILADAQRLLRDGDTNAARALVDHAQVLVKQIEEQGRLHEQGQSNPFDIVGVLSQKSVFDLSLNRYVVSTVYIASQALSWDQNDRVLTVHTEDMHRRAPPSDEASDSVTIHNLTTQSTKIAVFARAIFFYSYSLRKCTGVDRSSGYFV